MGALSATDRWHIDRAETIDWREWGEEFVVRVASRAETHLFSAAAGAVLLALLDGPDMTLEELYKKAFQDLGSDSTNGPVLPATELGFLEAMVSDFERLGIVKRTS
jgi:hypothetical protein